MNRFLLYCLSIFIFSSCIGGFSIKRNNTTGASNALYKTFFADQEGTRYFVKPLEFSSPTKNEKLTIDFTFILPEKKEKQGFANFSIYTPSRIENISEANIQIKNEKISLKNCKLLFAEKYKKGYVCRFASEIQETDIKKIFNDPEWEILIKAEKKYSFSAKKNTKKKISKIKNALFY